MERVDERMSIQTDTKDKRDNTSYFNDGGAEKSWNLEAEVLFLRLDFPHL